MGGEGLERWPARRKNDRVPLSPQGVQSCVPPTAALMDTPRAMLGFLQTLARGTRQTSLTCTSAGEMLVVSAGLHARLRKEQPRLERLLSDAIRADPHRSLLRHSHGVTAVYITSPRVRHAPLHYRLRWTLVVAPW